jgi:hypothetical protein
MTFTTLHIGGTALLTGILALVVARWQLGRGKLFDVLAVGVLSAAAVFLWRLSANMPQLNEDGLQGFSANDWAAPILVYLVLCGYTDLRRSADSDRFRRTRALVGVIALAVNVITI